MEYTVDNISEFFNNPKIIKASSPLEAVKKAYPQYKVMRDYTNTGNIIVSCFNRRGYCRYIYNIIEKGV